MLVVCLLHLADPEEAHGRSSILNGRGEQGDDACLQIMDFAWIAVRTLPALDVVRASAALLQHILGIVECGIGPQLVQVHLGIAPIKPKHHHGPRPDAEPEGAPPGWGRTATKEPSPRDPWHMATELLLLLMLMLWSCRCCCRSRLCFLRMLRHEPRARKPHTMNMFM